MTRKIAALNRRDGDSDRCGNLASAQQPKKIPRIGYLAAATSDGLQVRTESFGRSSRELGYSEGQNISIEYRYAEGKLDRLPELAAELIGLRRLRFLSYKKNDSVARAALKLTTTIPIIILPVVLIPSSVGWLPV